MCKFAWQSVSLLIFAMWVPEMSGEGAGGGVGGRRGLSLNVLWVYKAGSYAFNQSKMCQIQ